MLKFLVKLNTSESKKKKNCKIFLEGILPIFIKSIKHKQIVDLLIPYLTNLSRYYSFPGGSVVKNLPANTREAR